MPGCAWRRSVVWPAYSGAQRAAGLPTTWAVFTRDVPPAALSADETKGRSLVRRLRPGEYIIVTRQPSQRYSRLT